MLTFQNLQVLFPTMQVTQLKLPHRAFCSDVTALGPFLLLPESVLFVNIQSFLFS